MLNQEVHHCRHKTQSRDLTPVNAKVHLNVTLLHATRCLFSDTVPSEILIGYWWEIQKERDHWEDQDVGGWTILKWILET
jgi:hypothetical protein